MQRLIKKQKKLEERIAGLSVGKNNDNRNEVRGPNEDSWKVENNKKKESVGAKSGTAKLSTTAEVHVNPEEILSKLTILVNQVLCVFQWIYI